MIQFCKFSKEFQNKLTCTQLSVKYPRFEGFTKIIRTHAPNTRQFVHVVLEPYISRLVTLCRNIPPMDFPPLVSSIPIRDKIKIFVRQILGIILDWMGVVAAVKIKTFHRNLKSCVILSLLPHVREHVKLSLLPVKMITQVEMIQLVKVVQPRR